MGDTYIHVGRIHENYRRLNRMCFRRFLRKKEKPYVLNVVERWPQFRYPGPSGSYLGKNSGEEFLHKYLIPVLDEHERVVINLNGMMGPPPNWLMSVFGGIVDIDNMRYLKKIHDIIGCKKSVLDDIRRYIERRMKSKKNGYTARNRLKKF